MRFSLSTCKQVKPMITNFQGILNIESFFRPKDKLVFVMGATGTGKSRLAINLATHFHAEIVNSDKMQVYKGLDIVTNKVTEEECRGIPHHLLGVIDPNSNFTTSDFKHHALSTIDSIIGRDHLPIVAGGSNSYIKALVDNDAEFRRRFEFCFLWVDVSLPVLHSFVSKRVDRMVDAGFIDEVRNLFDPQADYSHGIRLAIGVPELDEFLRKEPLVDGKARARFLQSAISKVKENTCDLACHQLRKIHHLHDKWNWTLHRIDATEAFLKQGEESNELWENLVVKPSTVIVNKFLNDNNRVTAAIPRRPLPRQVIRGGRGPRNLLLS